MALYTIGIFVTIIVTVFANVARLSPCDNDDVAICQVSEVRIDPCVSTKKECVFKKGINASIEFDFIPNFSASKLKTMVYSVGTGMDIPFRDLDEDTACELTRCPTQPGTLQTLSYVINIYPKMPKGKYTLKWEVWNAEKKTDICCFKTYIKIVK